MRSHPPAIATWLLRLFAPAIDADALEGDLLEHYQRGRSAWWYWREVAVVICTGIWLEARRHPLRVLSAVAAGWIVTAALVALVLPTEYSLVVRYVLGRQARPEEMSVVGFVMSAPFGLLCGWIVARCAGHCRVSALSVAAALSVIEGVWEFWQNAQSWPPSLHFNPLLWLWQFPAHVVLILVGGGLMTRSTTQSHLREGSSE